MRATRTGANNGAYSAEDSTGDGVGADGTRGHLVLDRLPTASVTVTVAGHAGTDVTPAPVTLTFTTVNWQTAQTVTVTAGNDADTTNDTVSLTHSATSTDSAYQGITIAGVTVTVTDNDGSPPPPPPPPPPPRITGGGNVTPPNRPPSFTEGAAASRSVVENADVGKYIGAPLVARDPNGDALAYTLDGDDQQFFNLNPETGQLRVKVSLDYETGSSYSLVVRVADGQGAGDSIAVTIAVVNVGLDGSVGQYDKDDNGVIDRDEAIAAAIDYFNGVISKEHAVAAIVAYFDS